MKDYIKLILKKEDQKICSLNLDVLPVRSEEKQL